MRGGSSDTDVKAFTTRPIGPLASAAVTSVTPVAKRPRVRRKVSASNGAAADPPASPVSKGACASAIRPMPLTVLTSMELGVFAEGDMGEVVVRAVGAEWVHERSGPDIAVGARERTSVDVARSARERERPLDDACGGFVDERLGGLRLGEQRAQFIRAAVGRGVGLPVLV